MDSAAVASPAAAFAAQARARGDATLLAAPASAALPYAPDGFAFSYGEAMRRADAVSRAFAAAGYGRGAQVALMLENRPEFFWTWLGLNALGVSVLPLNPDLKADDLAYQIGLVAPQCAVALPERQALVRAAASIPMMAPGEAPPPCTIAAAAGAPTREDACALLFTSGTTGTPKCCVLSNDYMLRLAQWYVTQGGIATMDARDTVLTPLPTFHMNALACSALGMIVAGGTLVPLDRFHARRWWRTVADAGATVVHYLGVMPAILLRLPPAAEDRAHRLRFGFGAGVDPRHQQAFEARFGFPLVEAWAMTETGAGAVTTTADGARHVGMRCIGRPAPGVAFRIVDDTGADVPKGEPGELWVRAGGDDPRRGFFSAYLKDAAATREAWAGGWFHTGDVVRAGADGSLFFVDRKKNIVRRSGENIAVVEVEGVLAGLDAVAEAAVAPVADEIRGEEVFALIRARERPRDAAAARALAEDMARACAARLAYFKVPGYVAFVDALPLTATQKLQRAEIRALAARALADPATIDLRAFKATLREA